MIIREWLCGVELQEYQSRSKTMYRASKDYESTLAVLNPERIGEGQEIV